MKEKKPKVELADVSWKGRRNDTDDGEFFSLDFAGKTVSINLSDIEAMRYADHQTMMRSVHRALILLMRQAHGENVNPATVERTLFTGQTWLMWRIEMMTHPSHKGRLYT